MLEHLCCASWGSSHQVARAQVFGGLFGPAQIADGDYNGFADQIVGAIWKALMALHSAGARRCVTLSGMRLSGLKGTTDGCEVSAAHA